MALSTLLVALGIIAALGIGFVTIACLVRSPIGTAVLLGSILAAAFVLAQHGNDIVVGHRALANLLGIDDGRYGIVDARLLVVAGRPSSIYDHAAVPGSGVAWLLLLAAAWVAMIIAGRRAFVRRRLL
jgi:hypothetical protein